MCISINILKTTPTFQPPAVPDLVMGIAFLFSLKRKSGVVAGVPSVPNLGSYFQYTQWRTSSPFGLLLMIDPPNKITLGSPLIHNVDSSSTKFVAKQSGGPPCNHPQNY